MSTYMYVRTLGCMHEYVYIYGVCMYTGVCSCEFMGWVACCNIADSFVRSEPITGDPDPIWIRARCKPDRLTIQKLIHRMIQRFVPVHSVKTRRRFRPKIASFHVRVCSCIISLFIVSVLSICYFYHFM